MLNGNVNIHNTDIFGSENSIAVFEVLLSDLFCAANMRKITGPAFPTNKSC